MNRFIAALMIFTASSTPTLAQDVFKFYEHQANAGDTWDVTGYVGDMNVCGASTYWDNGSSMSIVTDFDMNAINFIVTNTGWELRRSTTESAIGSSFRANVQFFKSNNLVKIETLDGVVVEDNKVVFPYMNDDFLYMWTNADALRVDMPGNISSIDATLTGTTAATLRLANCVDRYIKMLNGKKL